MVPDQQRLTPDDRSNLVAYLDGELNDAQARAMATKLTQSVTARREADALRKTWELLDLLPRPKASEDFTARTLTVATRRSDGHGGLGGGPTTSGRPGLRRRLGLAVRPDLLPGAPGLAQPHRPTGSGPADRGVAR
jgi:anti-sigma factor RsiW